MSSAFTVDEFVLVASITDIEMSPEAHQVSGDNQLALKPPKLWMNGC